MKISVLGLGYVGAVVSGCLARDGHNVVGVDVRPRKVDLINAGRSSIIEPGLDDIVREAHREGRLRATTDAEEAVLSTEVTMVCVGTPSTEDGGLDLSYVDRVCRQIGNALPKQAAYHVVVVRSTMLPGSVERCVIPALEVSSGMTAGEDFGVVFNPEFLREASAVRDFDHPPKTVIGELRPREGEIVASLYAHLDAPLIRTSLRAAEMVKYVDNVFHALKITFANEIGSVCKAYGVDSHEVMSIFCQDRKLNISPAYLKPGFAFGGSCLPKDLRALAHAARQGEVDTPVLHAITPSNQSQIQRAVDLVLSSSARRIGVLGVAFKAHTDDLRESPVVALVEALREAGLEVLLYDGQINRSHALGANFYLEGELAHFRPLFAETAEEVIRQSDLIVIGNNSPGFADIVRDLPADTSVLDLVRVVDGPSATAAQYVGFNW